MSATLAAWLRTAIAALLTALVLEHLVAGTPVSGATVGSPGPAASAHSSSPG